MELGDALAWLDGHQNLERMLNGGPIEQPDRLRMRRLVDVLGHPEAAYPVIHVTGTNGKTSTSRAIAQLLMAKGLSVGVYTSPHLETINERISVDNEPISDEDLAQVLSDLALLEELVDRPAAGGTEGGDGPGQPGGLGQPESGGQSETGGQPGEPPAHPPSTHLSWFEIVTGAALRYFADRAVDVAVVEVGIGGRWDATNVVTAAVAVVTFIGLDHLELLGPTRAHIAAEKSGIITPGAPLVLGERDPELLPFFEQEGPEPLLWSGRDWAVESNQLAVGGRLIDLRTPKARYPELFLDLHGRHQAENFAAAVVAVEAFFDAPLPADLVAEAAATVASPGRLEVVGRQPLVVLDGAKNVEGARSAAAAVAEEFAEVASRILVVGLLSGKDPTDMLEALDVRRARLVVVCAPPTPRARDAVELAAVATRFGVPIEVADSVAEAMETALAAADPEDLILVSGTLYVVGAARAAMVTGRS